MDLVFGSDFIGRMKVDTSCSGVTIVGLSLDKVVSIEVRMISKNIRDKVLYSLSGNNMKRLLSFLGFNSPDSFRSCLIIPFSVGNLSLSSDDYLEVIVKSDSLTGETYICSLEKLPVFASRPLFVKKVDVEEFDSGYFRTALMSPCGVEYISSGRKTDISVDMMSFLKKSDSDDFVLGLSSNTTYKVDSASEVLLLDY